MGLLDRDPFAPPTPEVLPAPDPFAPLLAALDQMAAAIREMRAQPAPIVQVPPVDLSEVVMAVQALKGPATAEEIALALRAVLQPGEPVDDGLAVVLEKLAEKLEALDFRMKSTGVATGGGFASMTVNGRPVTANNPMPVTSTDADETVTAVVATVTASGDTTIHTPASGKRIRLLWVTAINDPDEATSPLVKIKLGGTEVYRAYAVAHRQQFEGAVDAALVVNLSGAASVAVTAHIQEF